MEEKYDRLDRYEKGRMRLMRHNYTPQNLTTGTKNVISVIAYVILELDSLHMNVLIKDKF